MTLLKVSSVWAVVLALSASAEAKTYVLQASGSAPAASVERKDGSEKSGEQTINVRFNLQKLEATDAAIGAEAFQKIAADDLAITSDVGAPALPFYAVTLPASPDQIVVESKLGNAVKLEGVRAFPAQKELCRCADDKNAKGPVFDAAAYRAPVGISRVESMGDFRGTPVSRVILFPQQVQADGQGLTVYPNAEFSIRIKGSRSSSTNMEDLIIAAANDRTGEYDYLIVTPAEYVPALKEWMEWKQSKFALRFKVMTLEEVGNTATILSDKIHSEYANAKFAYALIVGNQNKVPAHRVSTSSSSSTPSDLPYFAMGGANDIIPEVFAGRLVVQSVAEAQRELTKFIKFEKDEHDSSAGWARGLGVASDEGSNPSDDEYVKSIEDKFKETAGTTFAHFYQGDYATSTPANFNKEMDLGAMWVTYVGHGSGTSWPSFGQTYTTSHVKNLNNTRQVMPVWIDVACQNGRLEPNMAGERMMNEVSATGEAVGTVAFYGGTVNISWHPPAVLARGIAFRMLANEKLRNLGPVIQAGQVYLTENYSGAGAAQDNQRWYVLQGDPSLQIKIGK